MKRIEIISLRQWGKNIISLVQGKSKKLKIVAAWSRASGKISDFCANHRIEVRNDFENILDDNCIDAAVIAGPGHLHAEIAIKGERPSHVPLDVAFTSAACFDATQRFYANAPWEYL